MLIRFTKILFLTLIVLPVQAEEPTPIFNESELAQVKSVKKSILTDCTKAKEEIANLRIAQEKEIENFILSVLKNGLDSIDGNENNPGILQSQLPGVTSPYVEFNRELVLQSYNPVRAISAKKCSLQILKELNPPSILNIPKLIDAIADENLITSEYAYVKDLFLTLNALTIKNTIINQASASSFDQGTLNQFFDELFDFIGTQFEYLAVNTLIEFPKESSKYLFNKLFSNSQDIGKIISLLLKVDPTEKYTSQYLYDLIQSPGFKQLNLLEEYVYSLKILPKEIFYKLFSIHSGQTSLVPNNLSQLQLTNDQFYKIIDKFKGQINKFEFPNNNLPFNNLPLNNLDPSNVDTNFIENFNKGLKKCIK